MYRKALKKGGEGNQEHLFNYAYALYQANEGESADEKAIRIYKDIKL
jgi:hypothetical protein